MLKTGIANLPLHGGKDKIPYEIDKKHYDETNEILRNAIKEARLGAKDKLGAIKRLSAFYTN